MRETTKKRLLALLEADEKKLTAKIEADPFAEWDRLCKEKQGLAEKSLALLDKPSPERNALFLQIRAVEAAQNKAWDKANRESKNLEKWYDERRKICQEIETLKQLLY